MSRTFTLADFVDGETSTATLDGADTTAITHAGKRVANLHSAVGHYYAANGDGSGIRVRRADGPTPRSDLGGFQSDVHATSASGDQNPALVENYRHEICLFYENGSNTYRTLSGDRGKTWNTPVVQMAGILPAATIGKVHAQIVCATVQGDNTLQATVQYPGDALPSLPVALLDTSGTALVTDGTGVALSAPYDGRIVMAVIISGESDLSHWWSGDKKSQYWKRVT